MKKLLLAALLLVIPSMARAITYQSVRASTANVVTPTIQTGTMNLSSGTVTNLNTTTLKGATGTFTGAVTAGSFSPASALPSGSTQYIQNGTSAQANSAFNVSTGTISSGTITNLSLGTGIVSSETVTNLTVTASTITTLNTTNLGVSSMTTTLPMSGRKITGLANGTAATDAAAYGQLGMYSVVCTSSTKTSTTNSASSTFAATTLGCSGALSVGSHHYFVVAKGMIQASGAVSGNAFTAALFKDGANLDDSVYGQCDVQTTIAGISLATGDCTLIGYDTPGDTNSHAFRVYISAASSAGTMIWGNNGESMRMIVFEVP